ncbi:MAG: hypothetical protein PHX46_04620 [Bacilli bacterium]|nr:hypothetical protein [Bacilli bacterium]
MLKIEKVMLDDHQIGGVFLLETTNKWKEIEGYFELPRGVAISKCEIEEELHGMYLKLTCSSDYYFKIPKFKMKQIQYLSSSDGENPEKNIASYNNRPRELYIKLLNGIVGMEKSSALIKLIYIELIKTNQDNIEKHGLVLTINYKHQKITSKEKDHFFYIKVAQHNLGQSNILYNSIDTAFFALLAWWAINVLFVTKKFTINYAEVAILFSYLTQFIFRTIYLESTWVSYTIKFTRWIYWMIRHKEKYKFPADHFSKYAFKSEIYKQHKYQQESR